MALSRWADRLAELSDLVFIEPAEIAPDHDDPILEEVLDLLPLFRSQGRTESLVLVLHLRLVIVIQGVVFFHETAMGLADLVALFGRQAEVVSRRAQSLSDRLGHRRVHHSRFDVTAYLLALLGCQQRGQWS